MQLSRSVRRLYTGLVPLPLRRRFESLVSGDYPRVYDRRRFIFIHIPKTAGKSVCEMIGVRGACHHTYSRYEEILGDRIADYFVFTVVRHPLDRLVSAWNYMKQGGNNSREDRAFRTEWVEPYETFDDFVGAALHRDPVFGLGKFRPQSDFLRQRDGSLAEHVRICRFESLQHDLLQLPDGLLVESVLPHVNASRRLPLNPQARTLARIAELYQADFEAFGYSQAPDGAGLRPAELSG